MATPLLGQPIPRATNGETDFKSPVSEALMQRRFRDALNMLEDLIVSNGTGTLAGALDADPPNTAPSYIQDTNPTSGTIDRTDKFKYMRIRFLTGTAVGAEYVVTGTDATNKRLNTAENLFSAGVRSGDTYYVIGHNHDGVNSEPINPAALSDAISDAINPRFKQIVGDDFISLNDAVGASSAQVIQCAHNYWAITGVGASILLTAVGARSVLSIRASTGTAGVMLNKDSTDSPSLCFLATQTNFSLRIGFAMEIPSATQGIGVGIADDENFSTGGSYIRFYVNNAANHLFAAIRHAGGTEATLDTGLVVSAGAGTYYDVEARRTGSTTVAIYVDGVLKGTITTTIPTAAMGVLMKGDVNPLNVDYWQISANR